MTPRRRPLARVPPLLYKEWRELRTNRSILFSMAMVPGLLVGLMIATAVFITRVDAAELARHGRSELHTRSSTLDVDLPEELRGFGASGALLALLNDQFVLYLLLIPIAIPSAIAAYSIAGEREARTLEPLLATPIETGELLLAKAIAAALPAVVLTWLAYIVGCAGEATVVSPAVLALLLRPTWLLSMALLVPLLALLSTLLGTVASSRFTDPRAAQSVSALVVLPIVGMGIGVLVGRLLLSPGAIALCALALLAVDLLVLRLAIRVFARETILTRWK